MLSHIVNIRLFPLTSHFVTCSISRTTYIETQKVSKQMFLTARQIERVRELRHGNFHGCRVVGSTDRESEQSVGGRHIERSETFQSIY